LCSVPEGHRYEFTIKVLDEISVVIGIGKKTKMCRLANEEK
jgi:hypothetical protein